MPDSITWVLLPRGVDGPRGRGLFSLYASPEVDSPSAQVGDSVLADWPGLVRGLLPELRLHLSTGDLVPAQPARGAAPDSAMWRAIIPRTAPVGVPPGGVTQRMPQFGSSGAFDRAHTAAAALYEQALRTRPTERLAPDHPVTRAVAALGRLTGEASGVADRRSEARRAAAGLLALPGLTTSRLDEAVAALRAAGLEAEAQVAPLAPYVLGGRRRTAGAQQDPQTPGPLPGPLPDLDGVVPLLDQADVHQVLGLLGDHPAIARRLGLVVDLEVDLAALPTGTFLVRAVQGRNPPLLSVFDQVRHPWSSVDLVTERGVLTMTTREDADAEIRAGMLDLRPQVSGYAVGDLDVRSIARQLAVIATTIPDDGPVTERAAAAPVPPDQPVGITLPVRRDPGFVVAQTRRLETVVANSRALPGRMASPASDRADASFEGDAVLFADDVTGGYRVGVSRNGGPFLSLMRRVARYAIAGRSKGDVIEVHDEGVVEALTAVAQSFEDGTSSVLVGEEVFGWDGFSLGADLPGPRVTGDRPGESTTVVADHALQGYGLAITTGVEPGSLAMLRYGDTYAFDARAVDLAGNSLTPEQADPAFASAPARFLRHDVVSAPTVVLRRPLTPGETLHRVVVRSDGEGRPLGQPPERHLAPPSAPVRLVERHGLLDAAFGPDSPARRRARRALLEVAAREAGSFTDTRVPDGRGGTVPAEGIGVVSTTEQDPVTLPLPPGEPLPAGQHVFHDTDRLRVPYLRDPGASGVALFAAPDGNDAVTASYGDRPWPDARPVRLVALPGDPGGQKFRTRNAPDGDVLECPLAPGTDVTISVASTIPEDVVDVMDPLDPATRELAVAGRVLAFSPRQPVQLVHATRRPSVAPTITAKPVRARSRGQTTMQLPAALTVHGPTTARLDVQASWTEIVDDGVHAPSFAPRRAVLASHDVGRGDMAYPERIHTYDFGDTRRRDLVVEPVAATRFRDCFPELPVGDPQTLRAGAATTVTVQNASVPPPPEIHSVVPIFRWTRGKEAGTTSSTRQAVGVRVYLAPPWFVTGVGEQLGVLTYFSQATTTLGDADRVTGLVSRWGRDPVERTQFVSPQLGPGSFPRRTGNASVLPPEVAELGQSGQLALSAARHAVEYAEDRGLWYADIEVALDHDLPYLLRLALVRHQDVSASGCHTSRTVVTDWLPMASDRTVDVRVVGEDEVEIELHKSPNETNRRFEASLEPRLLPLPDGAPRGTEQIDITVPGTVTTLSSAPPPFGGSVLIAKGRVGIDATTEPAERARLRQGRLVVREVQTGEAIERPGGAERVMFLETFDWPDLF